MSQHDANLVYSQSFSHEPLEVFEVMVRKRLSEIEMVVNISTLTAVVWQGEGLAHGGQPPAAEHCVQHSTVRSATSKNSAKRYAKCSNVLKQTVTPPSKSVLDNS